MRSAVLLACGVFGLPAFAGSDPVASSPEEIHAAKFHAEGLAVPLGYLREGAQLILSCNERFAQECSDEQRQAAHSKLPRTLDLVTNISTKASRVIVPVGYPEFLSALRIISDDIVRETLDYDSKLLARFGAVLRVCPPAAADQYREYLAQMKGLAFQMYGGFDAAEYARVMASIDASEEALVEKIRQWKPGECEAASSLGNILVEHLLNSLDPWNAVKDRPVGRDPARAAAGQFLIAAALELEMRFRPGMKEELRKLNGNSGAVPPATE